MSIAITPALSLTGATVNQVFPPIQLGNFITPGSPRGYGPGQEDHIVCYNESQCGVIVNLSPSTRSFRLSAGAWSDPIPLTINGSQDTTVQVQVEYVLPNPGVAQFGIDYFYPGEPVVSSHTLGNSPVNLGGSTLVSNQLVNTTNNPIATNIIQIANTSGNGSMTVNNDGSVVWTIPDAGSNSQFIGAIGGIGAGHAAVHFGIAADIPASLYYGKLNILSSDGGGLTSDGSTGSLTTIGGLSTVGIGVPIPVQFPAIFHATTTGAATVLSFAPTLNANYRITWSLNVANGGSSTCTLTVAYNDIRNVARTVTARTIDGNVSVNAAVLAINDYPLIPVMLMGVNNAANIVVTYNDSTGTPNDRIQLYVERLA